MKLSESPDRTTPDFDASGPSRPNTNATIMADVIMTHIGANLPKLSEDGTQLY